MGNSNWISRTGRLPCETDADSNGNVYAWHLYQGVVLVHWSRFEKNSFHTYWMNPQCHNAAWVDVTEKAPTKADCDHANCIVAMNASGKAIVTGWHQLQGDKQFTRWRPLPLPPKAITNLKKAQ